MSLDLALAALADPTRRAIVERLARGPSPVGELSRPFPISAPAISRHLRVLESAALIVSERQGKGRICRIVPETLTEARGWFEDQTRFWTASFDRLDAHLAATERTEK